MHWLRITPLDVLFFRKPGPFSAGGIFVAETENLTSSLAFVGAIRAEAARAMGLKPSSLRKGHEILGGPNSLGRLRFCGPFWEKDGRVFFPVPAAAAYFSDFGKITFSYPEPYDDAYLSLPEGFGLWQAPSGYQYFTEDYFIAENKYFELLSKGETLLSEEELAKTDDFVEIERRVGIALKEERISREGHIYSQSVLRLKSGVGIVLGVEGLPSEFPEKGVLTLGGEGRLALYEKRKNPPAPFAKRPEVNSGAKLALLVLATPGVFVEGAMPELSQKVKVSFSFKGAVISKARLLGGFSLASQKPRPLVKLVPQGAVYAISFQEELGEQESRKFLDNFWARSIADDFPFYPFNQAGFGLSFVNFRIF